MSALTLIRSSRVTGRLAHPRLREVRLALCAGTAGGLLVGGARTTPAAVFAAAAVVYLTGLWRSA